MKVLLFLQLPLVRLGRGRPGWEAVGWSPQPLADLKKSRGRLEQSPGRALESLILLLQSPGWVLKSLGRLRLYVSWSRIRPPQAEPAHRLNLILVMA